MLCSNIPKAYDLQKQLGVHHHAKKEEYCKNAEIYSHASVFKGISNIQLYIEQLLSNMSLNWTPYC